MQYIPVDSSHLGAIKICSPRSPLTSNGYLKCTYLFGNHERKSISHTWAYQRILSQFAISTFMFLFSVVNVLTFFLILLKRFVYVLNFLNGVHIRTTYLTHFWLIHFNFDLTYTLWKYIWQHKMVGWGLDFIVSI